MPLSHLFLPLCGLLLAMALTAVTAAAPLYGDGEVRITAESGSVYLTRAEQIAKCKNLGGSLPPMSTEAVYLLVVAAMDNAGKVTSFSYMGGSSLLSSEKCTTSADSLECIWYWDQGRYAGADNAVAFYRGNRDPRILSGAGMIGASVSNHWRVFSDSEHCPCGYLQRYGAILRDFSKAPYWSDTASSSTYSYGFVSLPVNYQKICAYDLNPPTTTTTTTRLPTTTTSTVPPPPVTPPPASTTGRPTTTTAEPSESSGVNVPLVAGLSVAAAVVLIVIIAIIVSVVCCGGCSCFAGKPRAAPASRTPSQSWQGGMSRASSFNSRSSGMDRVASHSFRGGALSKNGSSRYSSARSFGGDAGAWQNDEEMASMTSSQYMRRPSAANMVPQMMPMQQPMAMPPQMMPMQQPMAMPPQMVPMQQQMRGGGSQVW